MTEFQKYILENHPDPDALLEIGDKFEQMCRLAENYSLKNKSNTGFKDKNGKEIYAGDILTDIVDVDGNMIDSKQKVFYNQPTGSWHLDNSFSQNESYSTDLWIELNDNDYEIFTDN